MVKNNMKGLVIIAILAISYFVVNYLFFKILVFLFPDKPTESFSILSFVASPIIAFIIGALYLKVFKK